MGRSFAEDAAEKREGIEAIITAAGRQARRSVPIVLPDGYEAGVITPQGHLLKIHIKTAKGEYVAVYDVDRNNVIEVAPYEVDETDGA